MKLETINIRTQTAAIGKRRLTTAAENQKYYEGDHLQACYAFKGYIGILPEPGDPERDKVIRDLIKIFAMNNQIAAAINRHIDGIISREPDWQMILPAIRRAPGEDLSERDKTLIQEITAYLVEWWNDRNILKNIFKEAIRIALIEGKAVIRAFIPPGFTDENGDLDPATDFAAALNMIHFEVLTADKGAVFTEPNKLENYSMIAQRIAGNKTEVEVSYLNDEGLTELVVFNGKAEEVRRMKEPINLGRNLFAFELNIDPLITEPVRSLQRSINYAITTMNKNLNLAGSRDTYITNAQKPKSKVTVKDGDGVILSETLKDEPLSKGGNRANFLVGIPIRNEDGEITGYSNSQVITVDPVAVETFIRAEEKYTAALLDEVHQSHVKMNDKATASGKSRNEARSEFQKSLKDTKSAVDPAGRWFLELVTKLAAFLCKRSADVESFRFDFNCQVDTGAKDPEEMKQNRQNFDDGILDLESFLLTLGVEDTDAAIARLESSEFYQLKLQTKRLEVAVLAENFLSLEVILRDILKIDEKDIPGIVEEMQAKNSTISDMFGKQFDSGTDPNQIDGTIN